MNGKLFQSSMPWKQNHPTCAKIDTITSHQFQCWNSNLIKEFLAHRGLLVLITTNAWKNNIYRRKHSNKFIREHGTRQTQVIKKVRQNTISNSISHCDEPCTKIKTNMQFSMHVWTTSSKANGSHHAPYYLHVVAATSTTRKAESLRLKFSPKPLILYMLHCTFNSLINKRKNCSKPQKLEGST